MASRKTDVSGGLMLRKGEDVGDEEPKASVEPDKKRSGTEDRDTRRLMQGRDSAQAMRATYSDILEADVSVEAPEVGTGERLGTLLRLLYGVTESSWYEFLFSAVGGSLSTVSTPASPHG